MDCSIIIPVYFNKGSLLLTFENMPKGGFDFVLMSRKSLLTFINNNEANPFWQV